MKIILIIILSVACLNGQGKGDYVWLLGGSNSTVNDTNFYRFKIDFTNNKRKIKISNKDFRIHQNNASICDANGNLLMYTAGCWISDRLYRPMPNGIINEGAGHDQSCKYGDYITPFGTLILPTPGSNEHFFLIHKFKEYVQDTLSIVASTKLLYSVIDISLNNGNGDVISKNNIAINEYVSYSDLTATRHSNNLDWWVISPGRANNKYFIVQMTALGPLPYKEQSIGLDFYFLDDGGSQSCFSPDGKQYARMTPSNGLFLMDFDRSSGTLSNFRNIITGSETNDHTVGVAFSPDSRFVYLSYRWDIYQYDTQDPDPQSALVHLDTWDGYVEDGIWAAGFDAAMLGPDCKIYIRTGTSNKVMHVIHDPNQKGLDCHFQQHGIQLPAWNHASIPNFVNYRLGYEPVCDSNLVMSFIGDPKEFIYDALIYPNPVKKELHIEYHEPNNTIKSISILNATGQLIRIYAFSQTTQQQTIQLDDLQSGIYFVKIILEDKRIILKRIVK
ncbi:MAG: T9SS type A sorting domain-containing protein [Saprospiraceae bacterium]|jgi:hypothetical protein